MRRTFAGALAISSFAQITVESGMPRTLGTGSNAPEGPRSQANRRSAASHGAVAPSGR